MTSEALKARTKAFALRINTLVDALPHTRAARVIANQALRSGTSVGANYRAACRARSRADFTAKLALTEEEADETQYWLELLVESGLIKAERLRALIREADELTAISTAARKTTQRTDGQRKTKSRHPAGSKSQIQNHRSHIRLEEDL